MEIDYLILADAAAAENGKHYIHGGGWTQINATAFPVTHPMMGVAIRLRVPWTDTNEEHEIGIDMVDADGTSILPSGPLRGKMNVGRPPQVRPGTDQCVPLAFSFVGLAFEQAGDFAVIGRIDGIDRVRTAFRVVDIAAPTS